MKIRQGNSIAREQYIEDVDRVASRFWKYAGAKGRNECWEWTGATHGCRGIVGKLRVGKRDLSAHRVSWMLHYSPIPNGMDVMRICRNDLCVNPVHLALHESAIVSKRRMPD